MRKLGGLGDWGIWNPRNLRIGETWELKFEKFGSQKPPRGSLAGLMNASQPSCRGVLIHLLLLVAFSALVYFGTAAWPSFTFSFPFPYFSGSRRWLIDLLLWGFCSTHFPFLFARSDFCLLQYLNEFDSTPLGLFIYPIISAGASSRPAMATEIPHNDRILYLYTVTAYIIYREGIIYTCI